MLKKKLQMNLLQKNLLLPILMCAALALMGCDSGSDASSTESADADRTDWPEKIRFGVIPIEGGADTTARYGPLKKLLEAELGIPVEIQSASSYQGVITAMANDQIEFALLGPKSYVEAARRADAEALLLEKNREGQDGYHSIFIVPAASPIQSLQDAEGKQFAFTDPNSTSGCLIPSIELIDQIGKSAEQYFSDVRYSGNHGTSILQVAAGEIEIAATNDLDLEKMFTKGAVQRDAVRVIHTSGLIPGSPIAVRRELPESLKGAFTQAILKVNDDQEMMKQFENGGFSQTNDKTFDIIRAAQNYLNSQGDE